MKLKIKLLSLSLLLSLISSFFSPLAVFAAYDQSAAQNYLLSKANNPWATMALAAQGTTGIPSDYLKTVTADSAVGYEAPILAITSLGQDPRNFGGDNYITKLENFYSTGQIGDAGLLNDDFFGILALASAGVPATDRIIVDSKNFILSHQNADGGWSWSTDGGSDSNDTAAAVMALKAAGTPVSDTQLQSAINYLHTTQNTDGGFKANLSSDASDSASTSWVIWALNSLGIDPSAWTQGDNTPLNFLASYQTGSGYFKWKADDAGESSPAITANAVIALTGKFLPIHTITAPTGSQQENSGNPEQAPSFSFRIEGSNQTVCEGQAAGPTALDVIKNASGPCGFTYHITTSSWGDYLDKINDEAASGSAGWLYFVNNVSPDVGAANYNLQTNDAVLWYFGDWGLTPTRLSLSSAEITAGGSVTATVEYYASSTWQTLNGADVYFGASSVKTGNNGQAVINPPDGYYKIYAQKNGFIRSNSKTLQAGAGQQGSSTVSLSANIIGGQVQGTSTTDVIAFTVSPSSLDFGDLTAGSSTTKHLSFSNTGTVPIKIQAQTTGSPLFVDNLNLDSGSWRNFSLDLPWQANKDIAATLGLPKNSSLSGGIKSGQIVFWASSN